MDTQALIARLRERAATQDACGCWSLDKAAADELERLVAIEKAARVIEDATCHFLGREAGEAEWHALRAALGTA